ncbi:MAG TPA: FmdB family zinc ribbon protein [Tepidisphaeraceae bacterium]|nr:FmdB family zinc ribbon protein [Tepidisphaeraceae bacterium]
MPTYEYRCSACNHQFERFQSITAEPIKRCPQCGKVKVKRLLGTGAGLIFKGSGFYITDYRSEGYKEKAKAESGAASGGTSSESKPASGGEADGAAKDSASSKAKDATASSGPSTPSKSEQKPKSAEKGKGKKS